MHTGHPTFDPPSVHLPHGCGGCPRPLCRPGACHTDAMQRDLATHPCRALCEWHPAGTELAGQPLFACRGCHSEWTPDQGWTPANADGHVPDEVARTRTPRD